MTTNDRILAALGAVAVIAALVIGGTTSNQSRGTSWDADTNATSQAAAGNSDQRGTSWD